MRQFSLVEVVRAGRIAENVSPDGAVLHYRPEQQVLGMAVIVEVTWPDTLQDKRFGLVEVIPDESGELLVRAANVPSNILSLSENVRLPLIPEVGWRHEENCNCGDCQN